MSRFKRDFLRVCETYPDASAGYRALSRFLFVRSGGDLTTLEVDAPDVTDVAAAEELFDAYTDVEVSTLLRTMFETTVYATGEGESKGAHYTADDITTYLAETCVGLHLMRNVSFTFLRQMEGGSRPERYMRKSLMKGVCAPFPDRVQAEADQTVRPVWDEMADERFALPSESWWETHQRRQHVEQVKAKFGEGEFIAEDAVTWNFDLRKVFTDYVAVCDSAARARLLDVARNVTVLDPTCGSGAFLLAAHTFLTFIFDLLGDTTPTATAVSCIYGVDLMPEAVDCVRMQLAVSVTDTDVTYPDVSNVRVGNAIVGSCSDDLSAYRNLFTSHLVDRFEQEDTHTGRVNILDQIWFHNEPSYQDFGQYKAQVRPFHWWEEFPEVYVNGGFDVVLGNPPYLTVNNVPYRFDTDQQGTCFDIYTVCMERAAQLSVSTYAMVVPLNLMWSDRYENTKRMLTEQFSGMWLSTYDIIPGHLFPHASVRNVIVVASKRHYGFHTSQYKKWVTAYRPHLIDTLWYGEHYDVPDIWPKTAHEGLMGFASDTSVTVADWLSDKPTDFPLSYKVTARYWISVFVDPPPAADAKRNRMPQRRVETMYAKDAETQKMLVALLNSEIYMMWWIWHSGMFMVSAPLLGSFPLDFAALTSQERATLVDVGERLLKRFASGRYTIWTPQAGAWFGNYDLMQCRDLTRDVDHLVLAHKGLEYQIEQFRDEIQSYMVAREDRAGTFRGEWPEKDLT